MVESRGGRSIPSIQLHPGSGYRVAGGVDVRRQGVWPTGSGNPDSGRDFGSSVQRQRLTPSGEAERPDSGERRGIPRRRSGSGDPIWGFWYALLLTGLSYELVADGSKERLPAGHEVSC